MSFGAAVVLLLPPGMYLHGKFYIDREADQFCVYFCSVFNIIPDYHASPFKALGFLSA